MPIVINDKSKLQQIKFAPLINPDDPSLKFPENINKRSGNEEIKVTDYIPRECLRCKCELSVKENIDGYFHCMKCQETPMYIVEPRVDAPKRDESYAEFEEYEVKLM